MSERFARACAKKRHYNSERRANEVAKASQIIYGVPMNAYPCPFCKGKFCVGSTYPQYAKAERMKEESL
jgi:hypothetical protein